MKCPKCGYNSFEFLDNCKKCSSDLTGFKQAHGIKAIVIPFPAKADAVAQAAAMATAGAAFAEAVPQAASGDTFSWAPPQSPEAQKQGDDIFPDLDLGLAEPKNGEAEAEAFSFDLDSPAAAPAAEESVFGDFSFDEPPAETAAAPASSAAATAGEEESFMGLLESSENQAEIAVPAPAAAEEPAMEMDSPWDAPADAFGGFAEEPAAATEPGGGSGEFELESFGWEEEKPAAKEPPQGPQVDTEGFATDEFEALFGEPDDADKKK